MHRSRWRDPAHRAVVDGGARMAIPLDQDPECLHDNTVARRRAASSTGSARRRRSPFKGKRRGPHGPQKNRRAKPTGLARRVIERRLARGLTQAEAAAELGVARSTWAQYELGNGPRLRLYQEALERWLKGARRRR